MSKIGTAHIEIKPVLNEDALAEIGRRIETAIAAAVERGLNNDHIVVQTWQGQAVMPAIDAELGRRIEYEAAKCGRRAGEQFAKALDDETGASGPVADPHA